MQNILSYLVLVFLLNINAIASTVYREFFASGNFGKNDS